MKEVDFEYYVLSGSGSFNRDSKESRVIPYNIFNNIHVHECTNKLCVKYKKDKMSFEDFVEELDKIIKWQECGRCEYEICVADWPPIYRGKENKVISVYHNQPHEEIEDVDMWKTDCYEQAHMNIRLIAEYVLRTYYPRIKL